MEQFIIDIVIDDITIILGAVVLLLAIATPFINSFFRSRHILSRTEEATVETETTHPLPPVSIILTPCENARELERNLPLLLQQDYPADYEVIVVAWKGDSETEDVLKRFADAPRLYTTYIPSSSRYMSRKKLAITLGMKAAKHEWVVLTDIECQPASNRWLALMAQHCTDNRDLVLGYTAYDDATAPYRRFERVLTATYLLREDARAVPYRHNGSNLLLRKSVFIGGYGFRGNLKYLRGEYDFTVNKYATRTNSALELSTDSWMIEQEPTDKTWLSKHLFYMESRRHLRRSWRHRAPYNTDQWALHLNYLLILATIAYSIPTMRWLLTAAAVLALLLTVTVRTVIARRTLLRFREDISWWRLAAYEVSVLWHNMSYLHRYHRADKNDFISHKI